jgi:hypothetical protein
MVKLVAGTMPVQSDPDQVLASFTLQRDDDVQIGTVLHVPLASPSQRADVLNDTPFTPNGPTVALRVVGIEASEIEFPATNMPSYDLYTTQAFARKFNRRSTVLDAYFVRLHHGVSDLPRFQTAARALGGLSISDLDSQAGAINFSIHPQAVGWWILAVLAGLVGITVVAQALARQALIEAGSFATLRALGISRRQLVLLNVTRTLAIGVVGVAVGVGLAFLVSPLTPVGEARVADPTSGFAFDGLVLGLGVVGLVVVVVGLGLWPAIRTARLTEPGPTDRVRHPSRIVAFLGGAGAPPSALIGMRHALERGRGRTAVPVGSALLGSVLAVTALCATAIFGASLTHLTDTPALYGQPFGLSFSINQTGSAAQADAMLANLRRGRAISDITIGISGDISIDGRNVDSIAGQSLRGPLLVTSTDGQPPRADDEVALGATTLRQVGAHIGSFVQVKVPRPGGGTRTSAFRVVGTAVFSPDFSTAGLGQGAVFTLGALTGSRCGQGQSGQACEVQSVIAAGGAFLVRAVPGPAGQVVLARLARMYPSEATFPAPPTNLVNFGEAVNFPLLFGAMLIVFGVATLLHVLVVSVVRRRREVGLLRALGFVRRQVAFSMSWQTTTIAVFGIVAGVPIGIAVGRLAWRIFADNLGVLSVPVVSGRALATVAAGALLVANVLAIGPALVAARSHPASLLTAE